MEDQVCPRCRTTKYRNPSLKLMVNVCGHSLCESCVDLLFLKGSGSCPECQVPLRRSNFRVQLFEDPNVEKEVDIRKKVLRDYNKKEEDFATLEEYNDYLEEVEDIIYNLTNGINTAEVQKKIDQYKRENRDIILKNKMKIGRGELELEELLEVEKQMSQSRKFDVLKEEMETKRKKLRAKEALIDELMFSHEDAKDIIKTFQNGLEEEFKENPAIPEKASHFSTGIKFTKGQGFLPVKYEEGPLFIYEEPEFISDGPMPPRWQDLNGRYLKHVREANIDELAGGYTSNISCMRALQEAVVGLYFKNT
ncbi:CDK-activating kinase assembly factor MAT1 [Cimex lectularius]|uniref:CDK-activating kinase assembly factor MAT1 n=1 Tax=Cimex lectularius TaxID=79782 RepID=A0A8I6REM5_CIMLE|nr:CDK-activating kinase assembly factor MAT1 [Cimex lectularius]